MIKSKYHRHKPFIKQLARFGATGGATVSADYLTFGLTYALGVPLFWATAMSLLAGFVVSFTLNRQWVFNARSTEAEKRAIEQLVLYGALFTFNTFVAFWFIDTMQVRYGVSPYLAKPVSMLFITTWNFVVYKKVIFRLKPTPPAVRPPRG